MKLGDATIDSEVEFGSIIAVSVDDRPLSESKRTLLQAMTEEKATGLETRPTDDTFELAPDAIYYLIER